MRFSLIILLFLIQNICFGQGKNICYEPINNEIIKGNWENIELHLDTMYSKYSDSLIVPFTLFRIGEESYKIQDFEKLYKYSKLMLGYDYKKLETKFPDKSNTKWDWYCKHLPTQLIYDWGHFYLASAYLNMHLYDSCLYHLDSSNIENYISLPSRYTYNVIAGMHKDLMKSYCFQDKGEIEQAKSILIPYLFLDKFEEYDNFYSHLDIIEQYFLLCNEIPDTTDFSNKEIIFIDESITSYDNVSISLPKGWDTFKRDNRGYYILFDNLYIPIEIPRTYYKNIDANNKFDIEDYLKITEYYKQLKMKN